MGPEAVTPADRLLVPGYRVPAGDGLGERIPGVKATRASTGGALSVIESTIDGGPPRHTHTYDDESFYVLDGQIDVECGTDRFTAAAGAFVFLPRRVPHAFRSVDGPVLVLIIGTPGGLDEYFDELRRAGEDGADSDEYARIRASHGIVPS